YYLLTMLLFNEDSNKAETITVQTFTGKYYTDELSEWFHKSEIYTQWVWTAFALTNKVQLPY
ncbi:MAG: hypothetical protein II260_08640, partial [Muribaculaceae bacterium]|nr:hypothetical protein [Muribaculaceae bacterium]